MAAGKIYLGSDLIYDATGGGVSSPDAPIDEALHATYGDHFDEATLNVKWTRRNFTSSVETPQAAPFGGSAIKFLWTRSGARQSIYQAAALTGNWRMTCTIATQSAKPMTGIFVVDSSGNGVGTSFYDNPHAQYVWNLASWAYSSGSVSIAALQAGPTWLELRKVGTNYDARHSLDGINWSTRTAVQAWAGTPAYIGIGNFLAPDSGTYAVWPDRFNLVADA